MNKMLVAGLVVAAGAAAYGGGIAMTSSQVNQQFTAQMEKLKTAYAGQAEVSWEGAEGLMASNYQVTFEMAELPEELVEWAGTSKLVVDVDFKHSFLSSQSHARLADGSLKQRLAEYLANSSDEPLQSTSNYRYDIGSGAVDVTGDLAIAALKVVDEQAGGQMTMAASAGDYSVNGDQFSVDIKLGDVQVKQDDGQLNMTGISVTESGMFHQGNLSVTSALDFAMQIGNIAFDAPDAKVSIDKLKVTADQKTEGERTKIGVSYGAELVSLQADDQQKMDFVPNLALAFDLDFQALVALAEKLAELQAEDPHQLNNPFVMMTLFSDITSKGIGVRIDDLSLGLEGEKIEASADVDIAPFKIEEVMGQQKAMLEKLDVTAKLAIPKAVLEAVAALDPSFDPSTLDFAVMQGLLVEAEDGYTGELTVKEGAVVLNGNPLPL